MKVPVDLSAFSGCRILVVGDLMLDEYVWGSVDRISPEAPVQIVAVEREEYTLGGAGNVVHNLSSLGARVSVAGVIGTLADGDRLMAMFTALGVDASGVVRDPARPTTRKTRIIAANQHVLRIDREARSSIPEETCRRLDGFIRRKLPASDVMLLSDYGKGVVTPSLVRTAAQVADSCGRIVIADPKGLDFSKYAGLSMLTPNQKEAALAAGMEITDDASLSRAAHRILKTSGVRHLLVTRGKDGMVLFQEGNAPYVIPAQARQVYDVSGAGDTVISVLGLGVAAGLSFREAAEMANTAAGIVVGKVGTATITPAELSAALKHDDIFQKDKSLPEIPSIVADLRRKNKRIVLTNGCFDLLHAGHIQLLSASKRMGDILIVAIDDDASVRRLKGDGRPVIGARERVQILSALDSVDYVVVFSTEALPDLIDAIRPDVLTKGSNYAADEVLGHEQVVRMGGEVALVKITEQASSSEIIQNIRSSPAA
ncbi:D-glycero-beta-D-manno-heptose-7-phosphate kinase [Desulfococcus sp.]|uniref:D-glycero-beta-D-manno-heptose-7-phosphate kinase n=1 Tax=Desulfococcus sp. TaxID=2025834 RepID=UPI003593AB95